MDIIKSNDNPKVKYAVKLKQNAKFRREEGLFFLEGLRLCLDASRVGICTHTVFYTSKFKTEYGPELATLLETTANAYEVGEGVMNKMSDTVTPQGIISLVKIPEAQSLSAADGLFVALDKISDPKNLGAISRSAEALGVKALILSSDSCDPYSPKSLRASMGALLRLPIFIAPDFVSTLQSLKNDGMTVYSSVVDNSACDIRNITTSNKRVLVIGNEANGVSDEVRDITDMLITIPMFGNAESFNASSAASILIWEMQRGR